MRIYLFIIALVFCFISSNAQILRHRANIFGSIDDQVIGATYQYSHPISNDRESLLLTTRFGFVGDIFNLNNIVFGESQRYRYGQIAVGLTAYNQSGLFSAMAIAGNIYDLEIRGNINRFRVISGYQNYKDNKISNGEYKAGLEVVLGGRFYEGGCYEYSYGSLVSLSVTPTTSVNTPFKSYSVFFNLNIYFDAY